MEMTKALKQQQNEINDYALYSALSHREKDAHNKNVYESIALEKKEHYLFGEKITGKTVKPFGVALISFVIGYGVHHYLGIQI